MKNCFIILSLVFFTNNVLAEIKENVIKNLNNTHNFFFNFEQNINGQIETGDCTVQYPKKIYCNYNLTNKKKLISNGKSLVIKTNTSYYLYPLEKTPLYLILDKNFLINKILNTKERIVEDKFINFSFNQNDNEINVFFDKESYNLIGWQTTDIYQNLNITFLSSILKNQNLNKDMFVLPKRIN